MYSYEPATAWTLTSKRMAHVARVKNQEEAIKVIEDVRQRRLTITLRGAGYSYADEILNTEGVILDLSPMNRILGWNPETGRMRVEPGVTFEQALLRSLPDNWVIPAVPGIKGPTLGGALSNNIHGKNSYRDGNIGDAVVSFRLLTSDGQTRHCSRQENADLFFGAIGGLGLLGVFLEIELQCKKIPSPYLEVRKWTVPNFTKMMEDMRDLRSTSTYHIAWVDCFTQGRNFGRGTIHTAEFVEKPPKAREKDHALNYISPYLFGVFPRSWLWPLIKPFFGNRLMHSINSAKYWVDKATSRSQSHLQNFFQFTFLLDMIPNWRQLFTPHGYCELEPVIPFDTCEAAFRDLIKLTQDYGTPSHLTAIKSHRKDDFLLSYSIDGCTIGIDIPIEPRRQSEFDRLFHRMNEITLRAGGRQYLAKDENLSAEHFREMYSTWKKFEELKSRIDPGLLFQSDMYRRLFPQPSLVPSMPPR